MGEWSELLPELLIEIHQHLELYPDKIRFGCVCTHWQSTSPVELPDLRQPQPPWLLMPYESGSVCGLYHPFEKKVYEVDLPEAGEKIFTGSGHGWVVTVQLDGSINVVNPLTRVRVPLPPRYKIPDVLEYCPDKPGDEYLFEARGSMSPVTLDSMTVRNYKLKKVAISCSPTSNDFRAVAISGDRFRLSYCKVGDEKWCEFDQDRGHYCDIAFCGAKLYAMTNKLELVVCDDIVSCPKLKTMLVPVPAHKDFRFINFCLVNSSNGMMAVRRQHENRKIEGAEGSHPDDYTSPTVDFKIFKLDLSSSSWIFMEQLGDDEILFMGLGTQMGFSPQQFRGSNGNQIYFANDPFNFKAIDDCSDNAIFNFNDRSIKPLEYDCDVPKMCASPIWVTPNPY